MSSKVRRTLLGPFLPRGFSCEMKASFITSLLWVVTIAFSFHQVYIEPIKTGLIFLVTSNPTRIELLLTSQSKSRVCLSLLKICSWKITGSPCNTSCDTPVCVRCVKPQWYVSNILGHMSNHSWLGATEGTAIQSVCVLSPLVYFLFHECRI